MRRPLTPMSSDLLDPDCSDRHPVVWEVSLRRHAKVNTLIVGEHFVGSPDQNVPRWVWKRHNWTVTQVHPKNKAIRFRDDRPSLAMTHMWRHNACIFHNARLILWHNVVISPKGKESLNISLIRDPDHLRRGPSHGHSTSCVKKSCQPQSNSFWVTRPDRNTDRQTQMYYHHTPLREQG